MPSDVIAEGFPHDLDGHPALVWMGEDWVSYVALRLLEEVRRQDPETMLARIRCTTSPGMEISSTYDGTVHKVTLRLNVEMRLTGSDGLEHDVRALATLTGPDPIAVGLELETPEQELMAVLREAREYVARPGNDFLWSSWEDTDDALTEIGGYIAELELRPVRKSSMGGVFAPTGPMHELAVSSGWSGSFSNLAARFDAIETVAHDTWTCVICRKDGGTIELRESGELRRDSFTGRLTQKLTDPEPFGRLWDAIAHGDTAAVHAVDPELAPWWCPQCERVYCGDHWQRWDVFDDDGFHDSIRGHCPEGHERMIED